MILVRSLRAVVEGVLTLLAGVVALGVAMWGAVAFLLLLSVGMGVLGFALVGVTWILTQLVGVIT